MENPGLTVAAVVGLGSLSAALVSVVLRPTVFMEKFMRTWPSPAFSTTQIVLGSIGLWSGWYRETVPGANLIAVGSMVGVLVLWVVICRPVLPILCLCGGVLSNLLAVAFNGLRMPVPGSCIVCGAHVGTHAATRMLWLTDRIVLDWRGTQAMSAISVGDILITIGLALIAVRMMQHRRETSVRPEGRPHHRHDHRRQRPAHRHGLGRLQPEARQLQLQARPPDRAWPRAEGVPRDPGERGLLMAAIWKFPFNISDRFTYPMPVGAQILKVEAQANQPCIWALVDPDAATGERTFRIVGTGHEFDPIGMKHVATFTTAGGMLVWHMFEEGFVTASGRVLTDDEIEALADEAERGYDVAQLRQRPASDDNVPY